ncbi:chromosome segregation protein SMC, partial [bacterium]|nr:chromosome segregation protein SMC [bacterium]
FEQEKESDRFEFLKTQRSDLEDSRKTLKQTIAKLDKEAKKRYLDTFNDVNKHLKTTFSMFFEGGESSLNLTDKDNPLESNIEIVAKPPGKKVKKLNSLSAGEKALTAISILFAIYLKKPSPFCVLDEVDAPLDDNNVYKFTNVLKKFSKKTQFIIITHNKLTMNQCDLLHGVTQEQEGISKIVSVKLNN